MLAKSATPSEILAQETPQQQMENHPVIRTLYDHTKVCINIRKCVICVAFFLAPVTFKGKRMEALYYKYNAICCSFPLNNFAMHSCSLLPVNKELYLKNK